jgi:hypothetical protein
MRNRTAKEEGKMARRSSMIITGHKNAAVEAFYCILLQ